MRRELGLALLLTTLVAAGPAVALGGQASARLEVVRGGLSVTAPGDIELPAAHLDGSPVTVEAPAGTVSVVDTRGGSPGWTLVAQAGRPVDVRGVELGADLVVVPAAANVPAGVRLGATAALSAPRALAEALPGAGAGTWALTPTIRLTVPADTASGAYSAILVVTIS